MTRFRKYIRGSVNGGGYSPGINADEPFNVSFTTTDEDRPGNVYMDAENAIHLAVSLLRFVENYQPEALTAWTQRHGPLRVLHKPTTRGMRDAIDFDH